MLLNKMKIPITRNPFNNHNNDYDDDTDDATNDDDHYYDTDQYNRFHTVGGYHHQQQQQQQQQNNTNNNSQNNNHHNNNYYKSNRQNNDIDNYQYYNHNTKWNEKRNQYQQKPSSIASIASSSSRRRRAVNDKTVIKITKTKRNSILPPPPSYQELNHPIQGQQPQQQQQHQLYYHHQRRSNWNLTNGFDNDKNDEIDNDIDVDNIRNNSDSFFGNRSTNLNDTIQRPPPNKRQNKNIKQKNQQNFHHHQQQQQLQQEQQLKYEPLKLKLFGKFSLQKTIIDPIIETDDKINSNGTNIYSIANRKGHKTGPRKGIKSNRISDNPNFEYPTIHHHHHHPQSDYNDNEYNNDDIDGYVDDNSNDYGIDFDKKKIDMRTKIRAFMIEFLEEVSAHGFAYLAKGGLHILERIIWILFIAIATFGIISLGQRIWDRFQSSPMVITMDRNKLVWNTSFPSLTVCPYKRIDESKVEGYMENRPKYFENEDDKQMFRDFVVNLANASYDNIELLVINKTFGIRSEKYLDLLHELHWEFSPEMSSGTPVKMHIYETITELGVCHAVNSMIARYNSYEYWKYNNWASLDHGDKVTVHPLDGEIYAQIINLSTAYDVYFHGAMEVPDISKQKYTFPETDYTTVELTALEIFTADEAKFFSIKQRKCRFHYEADEMMTSPIYTFGLCRTECRMKLALKVCKCVPHFYRNKVRSGQELPVCGIEGFACLARIKKDIIALKSEVMTIECDCQPNCDDSNFFVQSYKSRIWFLGANLQWGISSYPKMQLRREILFTFADVLVYIGGLAGFFLGCSILSFTEFIYFFTVRLVKRLIFG